MEIIVTNTHLIRIWNNSERAMIRRDELLSRRGTHGIPEAITKLVRNALNPNNPKLRAVLTKLKGKL